MDHRSYSGCRLDDLVIKARIEWRSSDRVLAMFWMYVVASETMIAVFRLMTSFRWRLQRQGQIRQPIPYLYDIFTRP